jgi:hypothetical protein
MSQDCKSEWKNVPATHDITNTETTNTDMWIYVDNTTAAETVEKVETSKIQNMVNELTEKTYRDKFQFNGKKCKELRISFTKITLNTRICYQS